MSESFVIEYRFDDDDRERSFKCTTLERMATVANRLLVDDIFDQDVHNSLWNASYHGRYEFAKNYSKLSLLAKTYIHHFETVLSNFCKTKRDVVFFGQNDRETLERVYIIKIHTNDWYSYRHDLLRLHTFSNYLVEYATRVYFIVNHHNDKYLLRLPYEQGINKETLAIVELWQKGCQNQSVFEPWEFYVLVQIFPFPWHWDPRLSDFLIDEIVDSCFGSNGLRDLVSSVIVPYLVK